MPELPEVETIARTLEPKLSGLTFTGMQVMLPKIVSTPSDIGLFTDRLSGKKIEQVSRRGKYLLFSLTEDYTLVFHFRMTGSLVYCQAEQPVAKHTHVVMELDNGDLLRYADMRQFGRIWLFANEDLEQLHGYNTLGIEPLSTSFTTNYFRKELKSQHRQIKQILLDQTFIAGLGNIYTDEALNRAKINPETTATSLNPRAVSKLHKSIRAVLQEGINNRGTTISDYIDGEGRSGEFQNKLRVYGKEGLPCANCGTAIVRKKIDGRSSYYCPSCQKKWF